MLSFLCSLITVSPKPVHTREELLVVFEIFSRDPDLFPTGTGVAMWDREEVHQET